MKTAMKMLLHVRMKTMLRLSTRLIMQCLPIRMNVLMMKTGIMLLI